MYFTSSVARNTCSRGEVTLLRALRKSLADPVILLLLHVLTVTDGVCMHT